MKKETVPSTSQSTGKSERIMSIICEKLLIIIGEKIGGKASDADASKKEKNVLPPDLGKGKHPKKLPCQGNSLLVIIVLQVLFIEELLIFFGKNNSFHGRR